MKIKKSEVNKVLDLLKERYPEAACALHHGDVYQLLVAVTLSAQTTDVSVNKISGKLFERFPDAKAMSQAKQSEVEEVIKSIGLYKTKAKRLIDQAKMIVSEFDGQVPEDDTLLQRLPGVGQKTANVVMADGFGHQRIAVDTHVFRITNLIGLAQADNVKETEEQLKKMIPQDRWTEAHHTLIFHGRNICIARRPKCEICPVSSLCKNKPKSKA